MDTPFDLNSLRNSLGQTQARWRAKDTPFTRLASDQRKRLLGASPSRESLVFLSSMTVAPWRSTPAFAPEVDWRKNGGNHITPVRDQGGCGSAVSFSCVGLIEAMAHIECGESLDLSEADAQFCSSHGPNQLGWWPDECLDQAMIRGVCDEEGFTYGSAFPGGNSWTTEPKCRVMDDRPAHAVKIGGRKTLGSPTAIKNYLTAVGPVVGCFDVYSDFYHYEGGVYHRVAGRKEGGHCVLVIGYSESSQSWLVKNSWGPAWGDGGFGRIAYNDFLFDGHFFPMYGASEVIEPPAGYHRARQVAAY